MEQHKEKEDNDNPNAHERVLEKAQFESLSIRSQALEQPSGPFYPNG